jgi:hypothetical protein
MKTYKVVVTDLGDETFQTIEATEGEKILWIPTDPANSDYAEYLRYTEWVEAGNNPDEFWTQSEGEI